MSVQVGAGVEALSTATELIRESYVVARGRFTGGPTAVQTSPDGEGKAHSLVVGVRARRGVPRRADRRSPVAGCGLRVAEARRGSILVAASANEVGRKRGWDSGPEVMVAGYGICVGQTPAASVFDLVDEGWSEEDAEAFVQAAQKHLC